MKTFIHYALMTPLVAGTLARETRMERGTLRPWFGLKALSIAVLLLSSAGLAVAEPVLISEMDLHAFLGTESDDRIVAENQESTLGPFTASESDPDGRSVQTTGFVQNGVVKSSASATGGRFIHVSDDFSVALYNDVRAFSLVRFVDTITLTSDTLPNGTPVMLSTTLVPTYSITGDCNPIQSPETNTDQVIEGSYLFLARAEFGDAALVPIGNELEVIDECGAKTATTAGTIPGIIGEEITFRVTLRADVFSGGSLKTVAIDE